MKIVITGASGNIGTALLRSLSRTADRELIGIARRRPPLTQEHYSRVRWIECDIGEPAAVSVLTDTFTGADAVVHLAWAVHPRRTDPPMDRTNTGGSAHVLRAVSAAGVAQLVCASSVAAYTPTDRWRRVDEYQPRTGLPGSAYSRGKVALEAELDAFEHREPAIRVARIRPCAVVQGDAAAELGDWLFGPWLPRPLIGRRWTPVPLWKDLRLQLVHADDVAAAVRAIIEQRAAGAFNLAVDPPLSVQMLATTFGGFRAPVSRTILAAGAAAGWRLGLLPLHPAWLDLADRVCLVDSGKARRELGWVPRYDAGAACNELAKKMHAGHAGRSGPLAPARPRVRFGRPTHQSQNPLY
ncbi:NAD-dependent epimerase/dehydratase family protein [Nocardia flavorosea]|uniref:NAD-dependent epimerase/dehydratase family protein n=1 Tax=Nocardia flavorosea TaxID=53429 RepID=UPI0024552B6C|nr:NAD-dependent epimerase/dehydratase family protein [Nocardia flavorosea]